MESNWGRNVATETVLKLTQHSTYCLDLGETSEESPHSPGFARKGHDQGCGSEVGGKQSIRDKLLTSVTVSGLGHTLGVNNSGFLHSFNISITFIFEGCCSQF